MSLLSSTISLKRKTFYVFLISLISAVFMYAYFFDLGYFPFEPNYWIYVLNPISISYAPFRTLIVYGLPIAISYLYYTNVNDAAQNNVTGKLDKLGNNKKLSEKYDILIQFKVLAFLLILINTGLTINSVMKLNKVGKTMKGYGGGDMMDNTIITLIASYFVTIFTLFCLTKIIDFLFDLDKRISGK